MAMVKCKGCESNTSDHDTLAGYCMLCAYKRVEGYDKLQRAVEEALALVRAEWKVRGNHPASNWAKEVEFFEQALKGK